MNKIFQVGVFTLLVCWIFGGSFWVSHKFSDKTTTLDTSFRFEHQDFNLFSEESFYFEQSASVMSVPEGAKTIFDKLAEYFKSVPNHEIDITGLFSPDEKYLGNYANLGLARAESFKKKLVSSGISQEKINVKSEISGALQITNDMVYDAISIKFVQNSLAKRKEKPIFVSEKILQLEKKEQNDENVAPDYKVRKLNLYFPQSTYKLKIVPELKEYFEEVLDYLAKNPGSKVQITGHTDNKGDRKVNIRLSKYRARAVRDFMFEHGFKKNQIVIDYKGPDEPIDTNDTEEGRTRNRRAEVRVIP